MQYCQVNWEEQGRNIGKRIGRSNDAELRAQRFTFGPVIGNGQDAELGGEFGRCNDAILSGELGGSTIRNREVQLPAILRFRFGRRIGKCNSANWEINGSELADATVRNWEEQGCNIGRRIGRPNDAELGRAAVQTWQAI